MTGQSRTFDLLMPVRFAELVGNECLPVALPRQVLALAGYLDNAVATPAKVRAWLCHLLPQTCTVRVSEVGLIEVRSDVSGETVPLLTFQAVPDADQVPACDVCGCTVDLGCWGGGGCRWAQPDLCSHCANVLDPQPALDTEGHDGWL